MFRKRREGGLNVIQYQIYKKFGVMTQRCQAMIVHISLHLHNSHLLHFLGSHSALGHLLALVVALYILFLILVHSLHILHHLLVARRYHISVLILHDIVVLRAHTLWLFALASRSSFLFLE